MQQELQSQGSSPDGQKHGTGPPNAPPDQDTTIMQQAHNTSAPLYWEAILGDVSIAAYCPEESSDLFA